LCGQARSGCCEQEQKDPDCEEGKGGAPHGGKIRRGGGKA
jgi:hypothetical protein